MIFDFNITKFYTFFPFYACFQNIVFFKFIIFLFLRFQEVTWRVRKNFLHFRKWSFFTSYLKNSCFVFRRTLRVFLFFLFSFLQMFSLLIAFVHLTVFFHFLCCFHKCYGFEKAFFTLRHFLPYTPSCFFQGIPMVGSSALKVEGLPTEVRYTDPAHLFVWITKCSAIIW